MWNDFNECSDIVIRYEVYNDDYVKGFAYNVDGYRTMVINKRASQYCQNKVLKMGLEFFEDFPEEICKLFEGEI